MWGAYGPQLEETQKLWRRVGEGRRTLSILCPKYYLSCCHPCLIKKPGSSLCLVIATLSGCFCLFKNINFLKFQSSTTSFTGLLAPLLHSGKEGDSVLPVQSVHHRTIHSTLGDLPPASGGNACWTFTPHGGTLWPPWTPSGKHLGWIHSVS